MVNKPSPHDAKLPTEAGCRAATKVIKSSALHLIDR